MKASVRPPRSAKVRRKTGALPPVKTIGQAFAPHRDVYHFLLRRSWSAFFGLVLSFFLIANALFAGVYMMEPAAIANARPGSFEDAFFFSVQTMATIGYGGMSPATRLGHVTVTAEAVFGLLMTALITGLCFAKFSRPTARVLFSKVMVIAPRNGVPHLMFRMANQRHNQIHDATVNVTVLLTETTAEGDAIRRPHEIALERSRNPVFTYTWLVMHKIDEQSPFYGSDPLARLRRDGGQLFVVVSGLDETVGQTITARWSYTVDEIVPDAKFADVLTMLPEGIRQIDYRVFHDVVPLARAGEVGLTTATGRGRDEDTSDSPRAGARAGADDSTGLAGRRARGEATAEDEGDRDVASPAEDGLLSSVPLGQA